METEQRAILALEDGAWFEGRPFGAVEALSQGRRGEVVFATGMTGYQEICTDPSYRGQMVVLTYPLVGNYGIAKEDVESRRPWLSALIVRECCEEYSNWRAAESLDDYLARYGIPGLRDLDTRALTRHLRAHGTLRGILRAYAEGETPDIAALVAEAGRVRTVSDLDVVAEVASAGDEHWPHARVGPGAPRVLLIDTGYKHTIARCLAERGLEVVVAPHPVESATVRALRPDGVLLSNGPGDPESVAGLVALTRALLAEGLPLMGICLGHQVLGLAAGARTSRLPFGHHGANHPVREVRTGRVTVTSQNHNFQVDAATLPPASGFYVSHINLSDGSVEGLAHETLPVFSVQYHPEAAPGPEDNRDLFDRFACLVRARQESGLAVRDAVPRVLAHPHEMTRETMGGMASDRDEPSVSIVRGVCPAVPPQDGRLHRAISLTTSDGAVEDATPGEPAARAG
ncbi:MAG: glutamine-hydrolyzing carbamoyl-phosphate synthase small subunit [Ktedonobacterales bacterium]|nr:glutamine-hydrolyzing carbamoyl-phosphate synthase small subunit [Ktedonobacterales bacterium]